jgi:hypothetical protein
MVLDEWEWESKTEIKEDGMNKGKEERDGMQRRRQEINTGKMPKERQWK